MTKLPWSMILSFMATCIVLYLSDERGSVGFSVLLIIAVVLFIGIMDEIREVFVNKE